MLDAQRDGVCHICGGVGRRSFEHVPPRSAFNDDRIITALGVDALQRSDFDEPEGVTHQRGFGNHTLCEQCNNSTGSWYGPAYAAFAQAAVLSILNAGDQDRIAVAFRGFPGRIYKQILCMFFSANGELFHEKHPELKALVLDRSRTGLPKRYRLFAFLNSSNLARSSGIAAILQGGNPPRRFIFSEIVFRPLGLVITFESEPPDPRLVDISSMADRTYDEEADISLALPLLPIYTPLPADYRDRETALREAAENLRLMNESEQGPGG